MNALATPPENANLRDLRLATADESGRPLSQYDVAQELDCEQPRISQIEKYGTKDVDMLEKLAGLYKVEMAVVLEANRRTRRR